MRRFGGGRGKTRVWVGDQGARVRVVIRGAVVVGEKGLAAGVKRWQNLPGATLPLLG